MRRLLYYIKRQNTVWLLCLLCCCTLTAHAQHFDLEPDKKRVTIPFRFVRNLVVIELKIEGKGPYNFILDTGVGLVLITDPTLLDSLSFTTERSIKVSGLGDGDDYDAVITSPLKFDIPGVVSYGVRTAILKKDPFGLSSYAGIPIHGLLGYEFFSKLAVKLSFSDSTVTVARPANMKMLRKAVKLPLSIEDNKPYLNARITYANGTQQDSKLVVDLGAGHPLSMENVTGKTELQPKAINANLGIGITGAISGTISRIKALNIGGYEIKNVLTSFPNDNGKQPSVARHGNLGIGVLKRFSIIFDYPNSAIYLKSGFNFRAPFEHDMSGLGYYAAGENRDNIVIDVVAPGSAAEDAGIEINDEIVSINFKPVSRMTLQQIDDLFKSEAGRSFIVEIYRDKKYYKVVLTLKKQI